MNPVYILLLIVFLIVGSICEVLADRDNRIIALICFMLFVLAVMQRSVNTPDTNSYMEAYREIGFSNLSHGDFNVGFAYLICIAKTFGLSDRHFFALLAAINYIINYWVSKTVFCDYQKKKNCQEIFAISIRTGENTCFKSCVFSALWMPYFGLFYSGTILRGGLALSLVLLSEILLYKKRYILWGTVIAIAMLFHTSAILGLLLVVPTQRKLKKQESYLWLWIGIVIVWISHIGIWIMKLIPPLLLKLYQLTNIGSFMVYQLFYANAIRNTGFFGKKELFFLVVGFLLIALGWKNNDIYYIYMTIFYFGILLSFSIEYIMNSYRIVDCFLMFSVPCGSIYLMDQYNMNKKMWNLLAIIIVVVLQTIIAMNIIGFS